MGPAMTEDHMNFIFSRSISALCVLCACAGNVLADTSIAARPPEQHQNGIAFLSGGQRETDVPVFERLALNYPLAIEFLRRGAHREEFLAGASVSIRDEYGYQLLSTIANGPFLLIRVPSGRYSVTATYDGKTKNVTAVVTNPGHRRVILEWPASA